MSVEALTGLDLPLPHYLFTMPIHTLALILIPIAYLLGSLSSAIITCKAMGLDDPRTVGSKNPGATNVLRLGGKKAAAITLVGDLLKGLLPVLIATFLGFDSSIIILVGVAAFLGHLYPIFYNLSGGKGVATAIGIYLGINVIAALITILIWFIAAKLLKISSVAALIAALLAPVIFYITTQDSNIALGLSIITILIYWRHKKNIQNLFKGTESTIGK